MIKFALVALFVAVLSATDLRQAYAASVPPVSATAACANMQPRLDLRAYPGEQIRVAHPSIRTYVTPDYPKLQRPVHGLVAVCVLVNEAGLPVRLKILSSSGNHAIDDATLRAARQIRFRPGTLNGRPRTMATELDYNVDLK